MTDDLEDQSRQVAEYAAQLAAEAAAREAEMPTVSWREPFKVDVGGGVIVTMIFDHVSRSASTGDTTATAVDYESYQREHMIDARYDDDPRAMLSKIGKIGKMAGAAGVGGGIKGLSVQRVIMDEAASSAHAMGAAMDLNADTLDWIARELAAVNTKKKGKRDE
jgi:hypothetical protein